MTDGEKLMKIADRLAALGENPSEDQLLSLIAHLTRDEVEWLKKEFGRREDIPRAQAKRAGVKRSGF